MGYFSLTLQVLPGLRVVEEALSPVPPVTWQREKGLQGVSPWQEALWPRRDRWHGDRGSLASTGHRPHPAAGAWQSSRHPGKGQRRDRRRLVKYTSDHRDLSGPGPTALLRARAEGEALTSALSSS